jgi:hypothetical protein
MARCPIATRKIRVTSQPPHGFEAEPTEPPPGGVRPQHRRGPLPAGRLQARRLHSDERQRSGGHASRLLRHAQVQSRVRELQAAQAQASQITAERLLAELEEARNLALSLGQAGAAVAASMGRAKLCGLKYCRSRHVPTPSKIYQRQPTSLRKNKSCGTVSRAATTSVLTARRTIERSPRWVAHCTVAGFSL